MSEISVTVSPAAPVNVTVSRPPDITVASAASQGPAGRQGEQGIQGVPGPLASSFTFNQSSASAFWTITHNLNRYPSVTVVDSTGRVVEGDPDYIDGNSLTISFSAPFSGTAYLN